METCRIDIEMQHTLQTLITGRQKVQFIRTIKDMFAVSLKTAKEYADTCFISGSVSNEVVKTFEGEFNFTIEEKQYSLQDLTDALMRVAEITASLKERGLF